jgi:LysM repeat protein
MTRKQAVFIIVVNAVISTLISLCIAYLVILPGKLAPSGGQPVAEPPAQRAARAGQPVEMTVEVLASVPPTATPIVYVVQPGDTISSLALKYSVPGADIIAANRIQNPDFLAAGIELIIPVGGLPVATATWTPVPTVTHTPLPFEPPSTEMTGTATPGAGESVASPPTSIPTGGELRVDITAILGVGDLEQERVDISNGSDQLADMTGWTLANPDGNTYVFPNYRLWPGGTVTVHTRIGPDGEPITSLFWGRLEPVWLPGEVATLRNAEGVALVTYVVGP